MDSDRDFWNRIISVTLLFSFLFGISVWGWLFRKLWALL
jgi:hypothetical protein